MKWLIIVSFLTALVSIFLSALVFKEIQFFKLTSVDKRILIQEEKVNDLGLTLETTMKAFNEERLLLKVIQNQQNAIKKDLSLRNKFIDQEISSIKQSLKDDPELVVLVEIEQLINRANQKSMYERSISPAISLMEEVTAKLDRNRNTISEFVVLKKVVDLDIEALKTSGLLDISKTYQDIDNILKEVASLKFTVEDVESSASGLKDENPDGPIGKNNKDSLFSEILISELSKLVEFGKVDTQLESVLTPKEDYLVRQRVITNLNVAQLSLLRGNNETFRESLAQAQGTLTSYFQRNKKTESIRSDLKELGELFIEEQGPSLSRSLASVRSSVKKIRDSKE